ncbi:hypothetical protein T459_16659 [Capsicum annuum]|uniref:Ubiquitin-like protease family profile domain-containing protein n=1 Tax=Capsicum annuum TaxID=4072 RepID=A0A2G2Z9B8_CAPAN|nr:hypothetical protein T459_16659 [Capsicum annuum]
MAQHANRSSSNRGIQPMNLVSDELPSFSLGLTQNEDLNLGSTNIQRKRGVSSEEAKLKHYNVLKNIMKKIKRKDSRKSSSPKPTKIQKSMKKRKSYEKGESSKIASPVSFDYEFEEEKVEEDVLLGRYKDTLASKRKDINRLVSKKSILVQSPAPSLFSSNDEDVVVSKKVFEKFRDEVREELNSIRDLVSLRCDHIMNAITENKNTKSVDENIREAHISDSQFSFLDEVLRSINLDFIKFNLEIEDESKNTKNVAQTIVNTSAEDESELNAGGKKHHLNEYINEFCMHVTVSWHMVDYIFIPVNVKVKHHWILGVISFNNRCIYVYDSLSSAGYDIVVLAEIEKLAEVIAICLVASKFYEKKGIDIVNHPNYKSYDKMNLFDVYVVVDLPQ